MVIAKFIYLNIKCLCFFGTVERDNFDQFWRFLVSNNLTLSIKKTFLIDYNTQPLSH